MAQPSLALALGGGGATGLGHLAVLEALDDLGIRPVAISGTSMGALIGVCFAAGMKAAAIRAHVQDMANHPVRTTARLSGSLGFGGWGQFPALDPLKIVNGVLPAGIPDRIEDLEIPFSTIVTDYHRRAEVLLDRGSLRPAIAASIAIPGVFRPQLVNQRVCIDGGVTNNLPYDRLPAVDVVLAVDVATADPTDATSVPAPTEVSVGAVRILMAEQLEAQLARGAPDVLIRPMTRIFGPLEFDKAARILALEDTARGATVAALKARGFSPSEPTQGGSRPSA